MKGVKGFIEIREKKGLSYKKASINVGHIQRVYKCNDNHGCDIFIDGYKKCIQTLETYEEVLEKIREAGWTV